VTEASFRGVPLRRRFERLNNGARVTSGDEKQPARAKGMQGEIMNQIRSGFLMGAVAVLAAVIVMNWRRGSRQRSILRRAPEVIRWEEEGGSVPEISPRQVPQSDSMQAVAAVANNFNQS